MLFSDLKVQAGLMTETELKRIEFLMRVMSSHQVFFYLFTRKLVQNNSVALVTVTLKAKIHGNGWEPQLTWEPVLWAQVSQTLE